LRPAHVAEGRCVPEREDTASVGEDPVALSGWGGGQTRRFFAFGELGSIHAAHLARVAEGSDHAITVEDPVASAGGGGFEIGGAESSVSECFRVSKAVDVAVGGECPIARPAGGFAGWATAGADGAVVVVVLDVVVVVDVVVVAGIEVVVVVGGLAVVVVVLVDVPGATTVIVPTIWGWYLQW